MYTCIYVCIYTDVYSICVGGRPLPCCRAGHLIGWARREAGQPQLL